MYEMGKVEADAALAPLWRIASVTAIVLLAGCAGAPDHQSDPSPGDCPTEESGLEAHGAADSPPETPEDESAPKRPEDRAPEVETSVSITRCNPNREPVRRVVRKNRRDIQHCHESRLHDDPDVELEGRVVVEWVISGATGDVLSSRVRESTLNDEILEDCITRHIKEWSFPAPPGGGNVPVVYPFAFPPPFL